MKSLTAVLSVFLLSSVVRSGIFDSVNTEDIKCLLTAKRYGSCILDMNNVKEDITKDVTKICAVYEGENCKEFLKDVYSDTTTCEKASDPTMDLLIKQARYSYIAGCSKDENGKLCPLTNFIMNKEKAMDDSEMNIIKDSCTSENCKKQLKYVIDLLPSTQKLVEAKNVDEKTNEYKIPDEAINATYSNLDTGKMKTYLDDEICSKVPLNNDTDVSGINNTTTTGATGNANAANAAANAAADNNTSSGFTLMQSSNTNLLIISALLIYVINLLF
ncbi:hypothetical protein BCR32DRAFT_269182 [Anaeromyces robustus]|jgi:hypothetical protein|uniref:Uncharacterized protein n=1 Tax=Anaeromyces robustus TaxID=1754192 RepID=A0A1Y1X259_9FUNG|nr:hypothetical protein BCR32DRAFT_269182 [Anaeromyces robustus]|eukprot:ORX79891.1 hypothetical protein BCR32DRAFT_269182 [Anaeromyces robustus]